MRVSAVRRLEESSGLDPMDGFTEDVLDECPTGELAGMNLLLVN